MYYLLAARCNDTNATGPLASNAVQSVALVLARTTAPLLPPPPTRPFGETGCMTTTPSTAEKAVGSRTQVPPAIGEGRPPVQVPAHQSTPRAVHPWQGRQNSSSIFYFGITFI